MGAPEGNINALDNPGGGRKSDYKKEYARMAYRAALLGATDKDLADLFDVSEKTIYTWKLEHVEFSTALKKGKEPADGKVVESLYKRATGYSHSDVDIKMFEGEIITTKLTKHYPPDTTAAIFWLKNRQKKNWRDKQEIGVTDKDGEDVEQYPQFLIIPPSEKDTFEIKESE